MCSSKTTSPFPSLCNKKKGTSSFTVDRRERERESQLRRKIRQKIITILEMENSGTGSEYWCVLRFGDTSRDRISLYKPTVS